MKINNTINIFRTKNCALKECETYLENDGWYASLLYEYADEYNKKHRVMFPKVEIPFNQTTMPTVSVAYDYLKSSSMYIRDSSRVRKASGEMKNFKNETVKFKDAMWCDIIEETEEMTIEDIEKILGHKVKIVSKEN